MSLFNDDQADGHDPTTPRELSADRDAWRARAEKAEAGSSNMWEAPTTMVEAHDAAADEIRDLRAERDDLRVTLARLLPAGAVPSAWCETEPVAVDDAAMSLTFIVDGKPHTYVYTEEEALDVLDPEGFGGEDF